MGGIIQTPSTVGIGGGLSAGGASSAEFGGQLAQGLGAVAHGLGQAGMLKQREANAIAAEMDRQAAMAAAEQQRREEAAARALRDRDVLMESTERYINFRRAATTALSEAEDGYRQNPKGSFIDVTDTALTELYNAFASDIQDPEVLDKFTSRTVDYRVSELEKAATAQVSHRAEATNAQFNEFMSFYSELAPKNLDEFFMVVNDLNSEAGAFEAFIRPDKINEGARKAASAAFENMIYGKVYDDPAATLAEFRAAGPEVLNQIMSPERQATLEKEIMAAVSDFPKRQRVLSIAENFSVTQGVLDGTIGPNELLTLREIGTIDQEMYEIQRGYLEDRNPTATLGADMLGVSKVEDRLKSILNKSKDDPIQQKEIYDFTKMVYDLRKNGAISSDEATGYMARVAEASIKQEGETFNTQGMADKTKQAISNFSVSVFGGDYKGTIGKSLEQMVESYIDQNNLDADLANRLRLNVSNQAGTLTGERSPEQLQREQKLDNADVVAFSIFDQAVKDFVSGLDPRMQLLQEPDRPKRILYDGKVINTSGGTPETSKAKDRRSTPPKDAIELLRSNPTEQMKSYFDATFGFGAADEALAQ